MFDHCPDLGNATRASQDDVTGIAVHAIAAGEYCWVFLSAPDGSSEYVELSGDDAVYEAKEAAFVDAYLAFRRRLRDQVPAAFRAQAKRCAVFGGSRVFKADRLLAGYLLRTLPNGSRDTFNAPHNRGQEMDDDTARGLTAFEKAIVLRQAGIEVPPHPKVGASIETDVDNGRIAPEAFLAQCEAWKAAVEEAHRKWQFEECQQPITFSLAPPEQGVSTASDSRTTDA